MFNRILFYIFIHLEQSSNLLYNHLKKISITISHQYISSILKKNLRHKFERERNPVPQLKSSPSHATLARIAILFLASASKGGSANARPPRPWPRVPHASSTRGCVCVRRARHGSPKTRVAPRGVSRSSHTCSFFPRDRFAPQPPLLPRTSSATLGSFRSLTTTIDSRPGAAELTRPCRHREREKEISFCLFHSTNLSNRLIFLEGDARSIKWNINSVSRREDFFFYRFWKSLVGRWFFFKVWKFERSFASLNYLSELGWSRNYVKSWKETIYNIDL